MPTQTNFQRWDLKYYYQIHCLKQKAQGNTPIAYASFTRRLKKMNLHDAIYTPRVEYQVKHRFKDRTPIQDAIRRSQINKEENIQILDLDNLTKLEMKELKTKWKNKVVFCKPKKNIIQRFISLFK